MFDAYYDIKRFRFLHDEILSSGLLSTYRNSTLIPKTASFLRENLNFFIDTSDGVNEDLEIFEYCGRVKKIIEVSQGKPFIIFKSAYSEKWIKNIKDLAEKNNGKVLPFFKWSFNDSFYSSVYGNKSQILKEKADVEKRYDVGIFFDDKKYRYPKPSSFDPLLSWEDHSKFGLQGASENTGYFENSSRSKILDKLKSSRFKIFHGGLSYEDYIDKSFECKVIINPPGIGEYTSRMVDQCYLGNCIALRKNSYDNAYTWKNHIPEVDFSCSDWEEELAKIVENHENYKKSCENYFENYWNSEAIVEYLKRKVINESL